MNLGQGVHLCGPSPLVYQRHFAEGNAADGVEETFVMMCDLYVYLSRNPRNFTRNRM